MNFPNVDCRFCNNSTAGCDYCNPPEHHIFKINDNPSAEIVIAEGINPYAEDM